MSQRTRKVRDSQTLNGTALVSGSSLHGAEPEASQEGHWWSSPSRSGSAHLPANGAAAQITLRLSDLGIVSLTSSRVPGSATGLSRWLSCAVAVGWLPGLECLRGSPSSLGLKLTVVEPQLGVPTEHSMMACAQRDGRVPRGTIPWEPGGSGITFYDLASEVTSRHSISWPDSEGWHRPSFVEILKPLQLSREKSLSYHGMTVMRNFCGIGQTKPNHMPRTRIADYNGLYPLS